MSEEIKKPMILIIDDSIANIKILVSTLRSDYKILSELEAQEGIESALANQPDLILLDIMMPEIDGYEVCRRLKADACTKDIPVIFITAKTGEEDEIKGFEAGGVDYIAKPFSPVIVKCRVKTQISLIMAMKKLNLQNVALLEAAQLKEDVDKIMRHDLKTPLNAMINLPQLILDDGNLNVDQTGFLHEIEESGYTMLNMINLSLDLFKMERGIYQVCPQPVNVRKLINKIISENRGWIKPMNLGVRIDINGRQTSQEDSFILSGENLLCYSMLANIIKNAIEASPKNATVTISLSNQNGSSIKVHNMGAVPENIRDRFFEKYSTSGKNKGTGLGTYSAMLIAKTMGGNILMDTSEVEGTTITISMPAEHAKQ